MVESSTVISTAELSKERYFDQCHEFSTMRLEKPQTGIFQGRTIPQAARLAGAAALVHELSIAAPVRRPSCVAELHVSGSRRREAGGTGLDKGAWARATFAE